MVDIKEFEYKGYEVAILRGDTASIIFRDNKTNRTFKFKNEEQLYIKLDNAIEENKNFKRIDLTNRIEKIETSETLKCLYTWEGIKKISYDEAMERYRNELEVYLLYDDNEALAESEAEIKKHNKFCGGFGYEK